MGIEQHLIVVFFHVFLMAELNFFYISHRYLAFFFTVQLSFSFWCIGCFKNCVLDSNYLSVLCDTNIFCHSVTCLFIFFGVSFNKQIFLLWSNQYLWLVLFLSYVINLFLIRDQEVVILYFFFKPCFFFHPEVFCLELTLVCGMKSGSNICTKNK